LFTQACANRECVYTDFRFPPNERKNEEKEQGKKRGIEGEE